MFSKEYTKLGGLSLLVLKYSASPYKLLSAIYPDYDWLPWKFPKSLKNFWTDVKNQRKFMDWAAKELKIKEMDDWYNVTPKELSDLGGITLVMHHSNSIG